MTEGHDDNDAVNPSRPPAEGGREEVEETLEARDEDKQSGAGTS